MCNGDPAALAEAGFNLTLPWELLLVGATKTTSSEFPMILKVEDISKDKVEHLRSWALRCKKNDIIMMCAVAEPPVRFLTGIAPRPTDIC